MEIRGSIKNGIITLVLKGRMDMANAADAEQAFLKYSEEGSKFVLDFTDVEFIASAGIRALLTLYRTVCDREGGIVTIVKAQPQVLEVLNETDFAELFNI